MTKSNLNKKKSIIFEKKGKTIIFAADSKENQTKLFQTPINITNFHNQFV